MTGIPLDLPEALTVHVGQVVLVPLPTGFGGAGNRWTAQVAGDTIDPVARVAVEVLPPDRGVPGSPVHSPGQTAQLPRPPASDEAAEVLTILGVRPGAVAVDLRLGRSWTPDQPLARHRLAVTVVDPGAT